MPIGAGTVISAVEDSAELKRIYIKTMWFVFGGYAFSQIISVIAVNLNITSMRYEDIAVVAVTALTATSIFIVIITLNRKPTVRFGNLMFNLQFPLFLCLYSLWIYRLQEIRLMGLFYSLIAVIIVMIFATPRQSIIMSLGSMLAQIIVSYYAIFHKGQSGDFSKELFFTLCVFPGFVLIVIVVRHLRKRTSDLIITKYNLRKINNELEIKNRELRGWQLIAKNEMELAGAIQQTMLPIVPPSATGWEIAFIYKPRQNVSGDFYDFYCQGDELKGLSLFDVSGHGLSSGLITMMAKPLFSRLFMNKAEEPLNAVMDAANSELSREIEGTHSHITGILLRFKDNRVEYINAGHPDLLVRKKETGEILIPGGDDKRLKGKPLGLGSLTYRYAGVTFGLDRGDSIFLYSNCFIETADSKNNTYGLQRIMNSFTMAPDGTAQEILDHINRGFQNHINGGAMGDDLTLILAKRVV